MPTPIKVGRKERMTFAKINEVCEMPNLIDVQTKSYKWFVEEGLGEVLDDVSPIRDTTNTLALEFADYHFSDTPKYDQEECKERDATYATSLTVKVRLINRETGEIKEQDVFMGDFPLMTEKGTFVYNGAERAIVTQMVRSPGPYYEVTTDKSNQKLYSSQVIPNRGAWLEYETDSQGVLYVRVDRTRKQPLTSFLRTLGIIDPELLKLSSNEDIIELFGADDRLLRTLEKDTTRDSAEGLRELYRRLRPGEPPTVENARSMLMALLFDERRYDLAKVGRFKYNRKLGLFNRLVDTVAAEDVFDPNTGEVLVEEGGEISRSLAMVIEDAGVKSVLVYSKAEDEEGIVTKVIGNNFVDPAKYIDFDLTPYKLSEKVFYPVLMEIIKQGQYKPMPVEYQVVSIFAAVNGYMQDIQIERIGEFEKRLIEYMELNERPFLDQILEEGKLSEAMEQELRDDIVKFRKTVKSDILIDSQKALRHEELAEEDAAIDAARAEAEKAL